MIDLIVNKNINKEIERELINNNFNPIRLSENKFVNSLVSCHPDINIFNVENTIITYKFYENEINKIIKDKDINIIILDNPAYDYYPHDILLNNVYIKNIIFCYSKNINSIYMNNLLTRYPKLKIVPTKQGYTKCSTCVVDQNSVITSDKSIYKSFVQNGIEVLLINQGNIYLTDKYYGFIGGASFKYKNNIYFFGNINKHPDSIQIIDFIKRKNLNIINLSNDNLIDYGGAIYLE